MKRTSLGIFCYNCPLYAHMYVSMYTCTHTCSAEEGEGVPWPFAVPVLDIWGADVDLCVSVATADGNIRALLWLSEKPPSFVPSLFSPAVSGSVYSLCLALALSICVSRPHCKSLPHNCLLSAGLKSLVRVLIFQWPFVNLLSFDTARGYLRVFFHRYSFKKHFFLLSPLP